MEQKTMLKSAEIEGLKLELITENALFKVNVSFYGYQSTRVFSNFTDADITFNSYLEGN